MNSTFRWQLLATMVIAIIQIITLVLLGRILGFKDLGSFAILQVTFRFALAAFEPGMFFSIVQQHESSPKLIQKLTTTQFKLTILSILILGSIFLYSQELNAWHLAVIACLILLTISVGSKYNNLLILFEKQKEISIIQIFSYSIELFFILITIFKYNPLYIFSIGILIRQFIYYLLCHLVHLKFTKMEMVIAETKYKTNHITPSLQNMASQILSFIQGQYDTLLIFLLFGLPILGPYNLASEFSFLIFSKINPVFSKAIFPSLSKAKKHLVQVDEIILSSLVSYLYFIIPIYFFIWVHAEYILNLAYQSKGKDILVFVRYFLIIALIKAINNILTTYLLSIGASRWVLYWNVTLLGLNYLLCAIFFYSSIDIITFFKFSIFYALIFTLIGITYLLRKIEWTKVSLLDTLYQIFSFLLIINLIIYINSLVFSDFIINSIMVVASFFIVLFLTNRNKFTQLINFKISE